MENTQPTEEQVYKYVGQLFIQLRHQIEVTRLSSQLQIQKLQHELAELKREQ